MKEILFWTVVLIVIAAGMIWIEGCHQPTKADLTPETEVGKLAALKTDKIIEKIYETNLLVSGFIVVSAIGVFCCFSRQLQLGLALIATGGAGTLITRADQSLAQNQWLLLIPTGLLVVGGGIWVFKNEQIRTALRQIVGGGARLENRFGKEVYDKFKDVQSLQQSKPTEKIVREIKAKL